MLIIIFGTEKSIHNAFNVYSHKSLIPTSLNTLLVLQIKCNF